MFTDKALAPKKLLFFSNESWSLDDEELWNDDFLMLSDIEVNLLPFNVAGDLLLCSRVPISDTLSESFSRGLFLEGCGELNSCFGIWPNS